MSNEAIKPTHSDLSGLGIRDAQVHWNLSPENLANISVENNMAVRADSGAISVNTGEFTGRSPKDRFIVRDSITEDHVWWGDINIGFDPEAFDRLQAKVCAYLSGKEIYARDVQACADERYKINIRAINELPWSNLFVNNMFIRPSAEELANFDPEWTIINAPGFKADPAVDGTRQHNFAILSFTKKTILIGGTGYTGEMKKGIFSALNFILPHQQNTLSMHCSANVGEDGDTAVFFGLSGTGKTTLSADPNRKLIGDDEHGWTADNAIFNFEGGCYAKVIDLSAEKEPDIFNAIKPGALLENVTFVNGNEVDFHDKSITENTRVSYPLEHIRNIQTPSVGHNPKNIFFLTADATGVLPPISKLTPGQAAYHFISGYTAKVAGTEAGITEPVAAFSACFGAPFMPLHPTVYAEMLSNKMQEAGVNVWLINTGWSGGAYGTGSRIKLKYTRAMITAALAGELDNSDYIEHPVFGLFMPTSCPNVPDEILDPKSTWADAEAYDEAAMTLAAKFEKNFSKFASDANEEILNGGPKVSARV
ncbi:phosphoenolpyruvate carboxykinase (ATP) [Phaeocystidibacter marisrubri]|uniref:Phosphoenolpyruvate carboxykinase (ATP) n=1 Tax=Phaeocystidibacter marisrubri TaxID=1577780 RepID=A0A6L3ZJ06_9FLAO|nr:phosphoenolpyruvate carboxykinase (ATP) [Phaeocystidibacter marisrubri]KAB2817904.1 phosphoenolpyruvate carboxykinase (ATP) [Phaeocystidibacter marisrubri]GGH72948.1 phosphoenolpyruvate carboxykinase (ATP) [Phaeocystidibacter marisrubri]